MKIADLERMLELSEYENSGISIELFPDIDQKVQELTEIIKSVPVKIWEQIGYEGYTSVDVERRERLSYYQNPENITIVLKKEHNISRISGVGIRNIFWDLAKYSKRYNEFCIKMCQWDISWLKAQDRFISEDRVEENSKDTVTRIVNSYTCCGLYDTYFKKLGLNRSLVSFCMKHNITDEITVAELKKRFVLEAFVRMSLDDVSYFDNKEDYEYFIRYWKDSGKDTEKVYEFWNKILRDFKDIKELYEYVDHAIKAVNRIATKAEFMVFEELNALDIVKRYVLFRDKTKPDLYLEYKYYGVCEGYVHTIEAVVLEYLIKGDYDNARELLVDKKNGQKLYDFLCNNIEAYQELMHKSFEDFEKKITKNALYGTYSAEMIILMDQYEDEWDGKRYIGKGKTQEEAISDLKEKFEKHKSDNILRIINQGFPEFVEKE